MNCQIKYGRISETGIKGLCKVNFEEDELVSDWLPQVFTKTKEDKEISPFDNGEYVVCLMDERCEQGAILGAIYTESDTAPSEANLEKWIKKYKDGSIESYDRTAHERKFKLQNTEFIITRAGFTVKRSSETLKIILSDILDKILAQTHPTPAGPSGPPTNAADFTAIKTRLNDLFEA